MTKEKLAELYRENTQRLKYWRVNYMGTPSVGWENAKKDLMEFINQCDEDYRVYQMENKGVNNG